MRSMFVSRSAFEKPSPLERCSRTTSPSRRSTSRPASSSSAATSAAIVDLPAAERPVSQSDEAAARRELAAHLPLASSGASADGVQPALGLLQAGPAALAAGAGQRAVGAADRGVAAVVQRVVGQARARRGRRSSARRPSRQAGLPSRARGRRPSRASARPARVGDWSRRRPVIQQSSPASARGERRDLADRAAEAGLTLPQRLAVHRGLARKRGALVDLDLDLVAALDLAPDARRSPGRARGCRARTRAAGGRSPSSMSSRTASSFWKEQASATRPGKAAAQRRDDLLGRHRLVVGLGQRRAAHASPPARAPSSSAGCGASSSASVSERRPRRSVSSGITSSTGMLPRLTPGPKRLMNHAWLAFVGASKMSDAGVDVGGRSRRRGRCASHPRGGRRPRSRPHGPR